MVNIDIINDLYEELEVEAITFNRDDEKKRYRKHVDANKKNWRRDRSRYSRYYLVDTKLARRKMAKFVRKSGVGLSNYDIEANDTRPASGRKARNVVIDSTSSLRACLNKGPYALSTISWALS